MVETTLVQMGRESSDQIVIHSSIALLQERFRQLQRVKEMRQGRDLVRTLPDQNEPSKLFFRSEILIPPPRSPRQISLSLCPKNNNFPNIETPDLMKSWLSDKSFARAPPIKFNDSNSDVDTSLHL
ncbi:hypothetical protein ACSBR2_039514 [Camellia fascicularis]